ncbi:MAG: type II toxin-antitoxin system HicB family antitoxin [Candidatus Sulfopaludibacter sp.]|nr:type II toxin-antitoxin system HicB family antitoxin [Candidatus Sulfopaludibacter sp.]
MQVLQGTADANIRFEDLRSLLGALGFAERIRGDHHIFSKPGVAEILNLQPRGSLTKPYQVRQVRSVIIRYKLAEGTESTKYEIILYWSVDDDAFIAEVPELPGCAADGPTRQEALANAEIVIQEWIETAQEFGRPIPEPKGRLLFA